MMTTDQGWRPPTASLEIDRLQRLVAFWMNSQQDALAERNAWADRAEAAEKELARRDALATPSQPSCVQDARDAALREIAGASITGKASAIWMREVAVAALTNEPAEIECHGLDTTKRVCFYEQDFYVLSNFSSFSVIWGGYRFRTAEHLYHWLKFDKDDDYRIKLSILDASSAHEAFKIAQANKSQQRSDWNEIRVALMKEILHAKAATHEYVRRKLLATGDRELVENSWRDDFWGWGPNRDGQNMLGKLWMEVRAELRAAITAKPGKAK